MKKTNDILRNIIFPFEQIEEIAPFLHKIKYFHSFPFYKIGRRKDWESSEKSIKFYENKKYLDSGELNFLFKFYSDDILKVNRQYLESTFTNVDEKIVQSSLSEMKQMMEEFVEAFQTHRTVQLDFDLEKLYLKKEQSAGIMREGFSNAFETNYKKYRLKDIQRSIDKIGIYPLDIMVTGGTGAGKSTTLNTLFKKAVAEVGKGVESETMELDSYMLNDLIRFWDTPGLGDGIERDKDHSKKLIDLLYKTYSADHELFGFIDMAMIIIEDGNRDMGTTYKLLENIILPNFPLDRIIVVINQCDISMKGLHWDTDKNEPDLIMKEFLEKQADSIQRRIKESVGVDITRPVYYSAIHKYHMKEVLDLIINNMPTVRRDCV